MVHILYNYYEYLSTKYSEATKETYLYNVNLFLKYLKENGRKAEEVTKVDIYNYISYMDNLKRSTIETRLASVKNYYKFINQNLGDFLFEDIKLFNINKKLPRYLTSCQIESVLSYYKDKRNYLILFLFLNTGIRISELVNIKIENINLKDKYIYLKTKGGYWRNVFLNDKLIELLKDYIGDRTEGNIFNLKRRQIHNIVIKPMREYEIKGSAHTLRHTYATQMYKKHKDLLLVKEALGHHSIKSTEIYTHLDNELVRQAVESNPLANFMVEEG